MNDVQCNKCKKDFKFANIQLFCQHLLCDQCLRGAHVQTQIGNQNQQNQLKQTKTNQLNCPVCYMQSDLSLEQFQYVQQLLLQETMFETKDQQDFEQQDSNIIFQSEQQINEQLQQQNQEEQQEYQKLKQQLDQLQNQIDAKNEKYNRIKEEWTRVKNEIDNKKQVFLNKNLHFQGLYNQIRFQLNKGQEVNQLQQVNKELQIKAQENKQLFSNLIKQIIPINLKHFENLKKQYQEVIAFKNQNEEKRKKNQEEIDLIMDKKQEIDNIKSNILTLNEEIFQLRQKTQQKENRLGHLICNVCYQKEENKYKYQCGCQICDKCISNYLNFLNFNLDKRITTEINLNCANCNKSIDISDIQRIEMNIAQEQGMKDLIERFKNNHQMFLGMANQKNEQNIPIENFKNNFNQNLQHDIPQQHQIQIGHDRFQEPQNQVQWNENQYQNGDNRNLGDQHHQNFRQNFENEVDLK